jgi:hypothetical protein
VSAKRTLPRGFVMKEQPKMSGCPALPLAVDGWNNLIADGFSREGAVALSWDPSPLWIEYKGRPVAILTFTHLEWKAELWINLAHVDEKFRRRGLYRALYNRAKSIAMEKKCTRIAGGTDFHNEPMRKTAIMLGRRPEYVIYSEILEGK